MAKRPKKKTVQCFRKQINSSFIEGLCIKAKNDDLQQLKMGLSSIWMTSFATSMVVNIKEVQINW
jgi:hypothetical protein